MVHRERRVLAVTLGLAIVAGASTSRAVTDECLIGFSGVPDAAKKGGTFSCDAESGQCTYNLKLCANQAQGSCTGTALKRIKVKGKCQGASSLSFSPSGATETCQASSVVVKLKKHGTKDGKCKITATATSSGKPKKVDKDVLNLVCKAQSSGQSCTTSTTTTTPTTSTTRGTVTTTTSPCGTNPTPCDPIVVGTPIAAGDTYVINGATGDKRCTTNAAANRFGACNSDTDCGNTAGSCLQLPWVTADGQVMPFPVGVSTKFTVNTVGNFPCCEHSVCVPCGNASASCAGIPGCEVAGNPNGCIPRGTQGCCDQPGFIVPTFFVNILGGLCSRVDQIACGVGVVNTSNPQTGDNEVSKEADTSDPGPDCVYGTPDDPAPKACTILGAGNDYNGKIVSKIGDGHPDADGIHYRLTTPELSTTWADGQSPAGQCANGSTYDNGELLVSQLVLQAQPTTAGASGSFVDMNGDGCKRAGAGFIASSDPQTDGPITVGPAPGGPVRPQPYDGSAGAVSAAVSEVFSGPNSPIRDIGFVAINPQKPIVTAPATACQCNPTAGCPE